MHMCRFAYTSYLKSLSELKMYVRGKPMDELAIFFGENANHR